MNSTTRSPLSLAKRIQSGLNRHVNRIGYRARICVTGGDKRFWIFAKATVGGFESGVSVAAMRTSLMRLGEMGYKVTNVRHRGAWPSAQFNK